MLNGALPLAELRHCDGVVAADLQTPTLADWTAHNLAALDGEIELPATCTPVTAERGDKLWRCSLEFNAMKASENVYWSWGVRFDLRDNDRALVVESITCIGAG